MSTKHLASVPDRRYLINLINFWQRGFWKRLIGFAWLWNELLNCRFRVNHWLSLLELFQLVHCDVISDLRYVSKHLCKLVQIAHRYESFLQVSNLLDIAIVSEPHDFLLFLINCRCHQLLLEKLLALLKCQFVRCWNRYLSYFSHTDALPIRWDWFFFDIRCVQASPSALEECTENFTSSCRHLTANISVKNWAIQNHSSVTHHTHIDRPMLSRLHLFIWGVALHFSRPNCFLTVGELHQCHDWLVSALTHTRIVAVLTDCVAHPTIHTDHVWVLALASA